MRTLRIAGISVATVGAGALFLTQAHPTQLASGLTLLPLHSLLVALAATIAGVALGAWRWQALLATGGTEAPLSRLFAALTFGAAVNNLVPARGGDAVRIEAARRSTGASRLAVAGTMVSERLLDGFVLALLMVAGALLGGAGGRFVWIGGAIAGAIAVAGVVAARLGRRVPLLAVVATVGIWLGDFVMYGALAHGFQLDPSLPALLLLVGAGNLALAVPGTAAGLGSFELLTLASAHGIGLGGPELAGFVLAVHAVIVLPTTLVGLALGRNALRIPAARDMSQLRKPVSDTSSS
jgi:uncharacterized membrane protein YbhN (UPF0104 family)